MTTQPICKLEDIIPEGGVCALFKGNQVAIFRTNKDEVFAVDNYDPFSKANVLSRGLIGSTIVNIEQEDGSVDSNEILYIASPIYKQRFNLATGDCLDDDTVRLNTYPIVLQDGMVHISLESEEAEVAA